MRIECKQPGGGNDFEEVSVVAVSNGIGEGVSVRIGCVEVEYEGLVFGNGKVSVRVEGGSQIGPAFDEVGYEDLNAEGDRSVAVGNRTVAS